MHPVDNQEAQPQEHQLPPLSPQDTHQEPQNHEQLNQNQAQQAVPQTHHDQPPGHQVAEGHHDLP